VRDAIAAGVDQTGASLIVVDNSVDGGPSSRRSACRCCRATPSRPARPHQAVERRLLIQAVLDIANSHLDLKELSRR
jgi:phosphoribosylglycinamide formyltransferase-1